MSDSGQPTMLAPTEAPEERELAKKRAQLTALEGQLAERELDLATLQAEIRGFEASYLRTVGRLFSELDELHAQVTESEARRHSDDPDQRQRAAKARARANASAEAAGAAIVA